MPDADSLSDLALPRAEPSQPHLVRGDWARHDTRPPKRRNARAAASAPARGAARREHRLRSLEFGQRAAALSGRSRGCGLGQHGPEGPPATRSRLLLRYGVAIARRA
jgi:hypothetical protein